ncbi:hypothetical protein LEP1GSC008_3157 [Leptospira kirschneri serovar Bulgarica str. Nikolaevo]|uniref:Uncharacterized protein n=1 Tax=Leptospira kirschneri serovar Bulgarica str. Nikolaevo TaxID=1240687 RepID=M6F966_9LEPT|nr:hypothetical protein LEP1GSC008_3157 [Leptospira kirschneri serovar Bulgarica str. Nikolaevo]
MMTVKQWFCAKIDWTMVLFVIPSSSQQFSKFNCKSTICESSHAYFFTKKLA